MVRGISDHRLHDRSGYHDRLVILRDLYRENENTRNIIFGDLLKARDSEFRATESQRSLFGESVEEDYQRTMSNFEHCFSVSSIHFKTHFLLRKRARSEQEKRRCHDGFLQAQERRMSRFDWELSWYVEQLEALIFMERDISTSLESSISHLFQSMADIVENTQRRHTEVSYVERDSASLNHISFEGPAPCCPPPFRGPERKVSLKLIVVNLVIVCWDS